MPKTKMNNGKPQAYVIDNISIFVCVNLRTRIVVLCENLNVFQQKLLECEFNAKCSICLPKAEPYIKAEYI